ncbi:MAG: hypothetical protein JSS32_10540 [Verrucomicrobia bacterium]|nr:hypothetical protein [Verrucomicrobiota bacterium]
MNPTASSSASSSFQQENFLSLPSNSQSVNNFHHLELVNPLFFKKWGPLLNYYFNASPEEGKEILQYLWSLDKRLNQPIYEQQIFAFMEEYKSQPRLVASFLGNLLSFCRTSAQNPLPCLEYTNKGSKETFEYLFNQQLDFFKFYLESFIKSIPGCSSEMKELATATELGRLLAKGLLDDRGCVNKQAVSLWLEYLPYQFGYIPEMYKKQIEVVLLALLHDPEMTRLLESIGTPCLEKRTDIHLQLQKQKQISLDETHSREAALSALLTYPRQEGGDCYLYAPVIALLQHDPKYILRHLKTLIEHGEVVTPSGHILTARSLYNCRYSFQKLSIQELEESSPVLFAMDDIGVGKMIFPQLTRGQTITPFDLVCHFSPSKEERRTALNRISSFFQNHLLTSLCQHIRGFSDNFSYIKGPKSTLVNLFSEFKFLTNGRPELEPIFAPLAPFMKKILERAIFIARSNDIKDLVAISQATNINLETLLDGCWGLITYPNAAGESGTIYSWQELQSFLFQIGVQALKKLKAAHPQLDVTPLELVFATWQDDPSPFEKALKDFATVAAQYREGPHLPDLANSPIPIFFLAGGLCEEIVTDFFQIPLCTQNVQTNAPLFELARITETLAREIPPNPNPVSPPVVLCCSSNGEGGHAFNLLPYNYSLKKWWAHPSLTPFANATLMEGKGHILSLTPIAGQKRDCLIEAVQKTVPYPLSRTALAPFIIVNTPEEIILQWSQNPRLAPHFAQLAEALNKYSAALYFHHIPLTQTQKSILIQQLRAVLFESEEAALLIQSLPNATMGQIEAEWSRHPRLVPFTGILPTLFAPFIHDHRQVALSHEAKNHFIGNMPAEIRGDLALGLTPATPSSLVECWEKEPELEPYLNQLQIELNRAVEWVDWSQWICAIPKLMIPLIMDGLPCTPNEIHEQLVLACEREQKRLIDTSSSTETTGMSFSRGARVLQEALNEIQGKWEYNQILDYLSDILKFPGQILLADLNYSSCQLWIGYQYGQKKIKVQYFNKNSDGTTRSIENSTTIERLHIIGGHSSQQPQGLRV